MIKHLTMSWLGLAAALAALSPQAVTAEGKKPAWVETVKVDLHGWTVHADKALVDGEHKEFGMRALGMLKNHLERIAILVPEKQLKQLRTFEIQIEYSHPLCRTMGYHPGKQWLVDNGFDPKLVKRVHIPRAADMLSRDQMLKQPAMILHELAHAYHDQVLGFDEPSILQAYKDAMAKGIYEKSLLYTGAVVKHYAATDHKEYFAEATEAYFYHNDFYPFVRAELKNHDPQLHAIMEKVWGPIK